MTHNTTTVSPYFRYDTNSEAIMQYIQHIMTLTDNSTDMISTVTAR